MTKIYIFREEIGAEGAQAWCRETGLSISACDPLPYRHSRERWRGTAPSPPSTFMAIRSVLRVHRPGAAILEFQFRVRSLAL